VSKTLRDRVMAMSDEELDAKARELTGRREEMERERLLGKPMYIVWSPSTDIAPAWDLTALPDGKRLSVYASEDNSQWWAGVMRANAGGDYWWDVGPIEADTAARAITRAFVMAQMAAAEEGEED